jgi:glycosyltransferase involved in cell wall biosynthesis
MARVTVDAAEPYLGAQISSNATETILYGPLSVNMKLISHVNGDNDLIEAWLRYYLRLGVDRFHLILHGDKEENQTLLAIQNSYPITIEDTYQGAFHIAEKTCRLDWLLARHIGQWVLLVDSDEFVEFPYGDIPATLRELDKASANVMAAPMLQRLTMDGSLETPPVIDDPFKMFPLCATDLYRRMGVKGDIFKFPLFFCASGTHLAEGGNHHPALGLESHSADMRGVTHHFKFRRTVSQRLERRIDSEHPWRHESVQFREYLVSHGNHVPLEDTFVYSREELFRRGLLKQLLVSNVGFEQRGTQSLLEGCEQGASTTESHGPVAEQESEESLSWSALPGKRIMFALAGANEFSGLEMHVFEMLRRFGKAQRKPLVVCFDKDLVTAKTDDPRLAQVAVEYQKRPESLWDWLRLIRKTHPDIIVFCYNSFEAFPWQAPLASWLAGVRLRISIQQLIPPPPPPLVEGHSPVEKLRRIAGRRARYMLKVKLAGHSFHRTICVANAVRDSLIQSYQFAPRKTMAIHNGVSTRAFAPCGSTRATVRARFDIHEEDLLLISTSRLSAVKGIDILIHAVSRALRQGISCKCIILGDGPLREKLEKEANSLGLTGYVYFEGFQKNVRPYLQAGSAFILTSHAEGLSLSVLEAMACGLPCIVTDVGGNAEAVKHQVTGLVIPPGSVDEAENAILYLATHPHERAEMARKSRETICQSFNVDKQMNEMVNAILN